MDKSIRETHTERLGDVIRELHAECETNEEFLGAIGFGIGYSAWVMRNILGGIDASDELAAEGLEALVSDVRANWVRVDL